VHAAVLHTLGQPPSYAEHPDPRPRDGVCLVRVSAAPLAPLDLLCATGTSYFGPPAVPYVPGVQGVGVVEESGSVAVGTRVWFTASAGIAPGDGSLAELAAVAVDDLVPIDVPADDAALAALGLSAVAAWMALTWRARMRPGERVLVLGGGGAVGQVAIGAAHILGADRVVAACRSAGAATRAEGAGADEVVLTAETDGLEQRLARACGGQVDVVIDPVFGPTAEAAARLLGEGGRLVNLGGAAGDTAAFSSAVLRSRSIEVLGYTNNSLTVEQRRGAVTAICRHADDGRLAVSHEVHPLDEVEEVWLRLASGDADARFVLRP
jgi:NADPH:quinone reductase-like Zn-dependent oxidoreductase